jgi:uncharacterized protein YegJ (DUF2314 family)
MKIVLLAAALLLAACSGESEDVRYQKDVAAASEEARGKLAWYWEHFEAPEIDEYDFTLKVALPRRDGKEGTEDVWVQNIAQGDSYLEGELMVDPEFLGPLREGAAVEFNEAQVIDWAFLRGEELIGHYTTRVMLPRMPEEQAEGLRSMFGENPT